MNHEKLVSTTVNWKNIPAKIAEFVDQSSPINVLLTLMRLGCTIGPEHNRKLRVLIESSSPSEQASLSFDFQAINGNQGKSAKSGHCSDMKFQLQRDVSSSFIRFSKSKQWNRQRDYYASQRASAWEGNDIPFAISNNRFVVNAYFDIITAKVEASRLTNSNVKPLIGIIEIGSGHGILSYALASKLHLLKLKSPDAYSGVKVVMTDFHDGVMNELLSMPWFL